MANDSLWLKRWVSRSAAAPEMRLVCLAHAGGGASTFIRWAQLMPPWLELCAVKLPGREERISHPFPRSISDIVAAVLAELETLPSAPLALFGHSFGGIIAFEIAHELASSKNPVSVFFPSAVRSPQLPNQRSLLHQLPDEELARQLLNARGLSEALLARPQLLKVVIPIIRADLTLYERYEMWRERSLDCVIVALGGHEDLLVDTYELDGWAEVTTGEFRKEMVDGGHFFIRDNAAAVTAILVRTIERFRCTPALGVL